MRTKLTHIAPLLAAGAAAVAISAAPTAAAAPTPASKTCIQSVSGSQCEWAGNVEINNAPTPQFTPQYPVWAGNLLFHHGGPSSRIPLLGGGLLRSRDTLADPRVHEQAKAILSQPICALLRAIEGPSAHRPRIDQHTTRVVASGLLCVSPLAGMRCHGQMSALVPALLGCPPRGQALVLGFAGVTGSGRQPAAGSRWRSACARLMPSDADVDRVVDLGGGAEAAVELELAAPGVAFENAEADVLRHTTIAPECHRLSGGRGCWVGNVCNRWPGRRSRRWLLRRALLAR